MQAIVFYLSLPFVYAIAWLPFPLLYALSDVIYVLLYHVVGYRKKIVLTNLSRSYPDKSPEEIQSIARRFYAYFCDLILETIKTLTITPQVVKKRVFFDEKDQRIIADYLESGQNVVLVMGHWGNWELAGARFAVDSDYHLAILYHPLKNKYFEQLIIKMRTRLGNRLYATHRVARHMLTDRKERVATAFIADQTPHNLKTALWLDFLHQDTPVFTGTERLAVKFQYPVIYVGMHRMKRGYYQIRCELLCAKPQNLPTNELTKLHTQRLEKDINAQPETWLWTHRRWKHRREG